jgi:hypothetical protein
MPKSRIAFGWADGWERYLLTLHGPQRASKKLAAIDYPSEDVWSWKNPDEFELPCDFI